MDTSDYITFDVSKSDEAREAEVRFGLRTQSSVQTNLVRVHKRAKKMVATLSFSGRENELTIGENCGLHAEVFAYGDGARASIEGNQGLFAIQLNIYENATFSVGEGTASYGSRVWISDGTSLTLGRKCLISDGVTMRTTDHHTIFDTRTSRQLNHPKDIVVDSHVWIGQSAAILKGVEIGRGSIIASHSVVTKRVPALELWGGVPAKRIRRNVSWVDSHPATAELIDRRRGELQIS